MSIIIGDPALAKKPLRMKIYAKDSAGNKITNDIVCERDVDVQEQADIGFRAFIVAVGGQFTITAKAGFHPSTDTSQFGTKKAVHEVVFDYKSNFNSSEIYTDPSVTKLYVVGGMDYIETPITTYFPDTPSMENIININQDAGWFFYGPESEGNSGIVSGVMGWVDSDDVPPHVRYCFELANVNNRLTGVKGRFYKNNDNTLINLFGFYAMRS